MQNASSASRWLKVTDAGLYCVPGDFHIDPSQAVARAVITHGHSDHARPNHGAVLATPETLAIMSARYNEAAGNSRQALRYDVPIRLGAVEIRLVPSGHILGAAQVVCEHAGQRVVVSGDYKRRGDPTCPAFKPVPCEVFVTEATFALPVFRHPPDSIEIERLLASIALFPHRAHLVGVYALGKCQRVIALLRRAGYVRPIYLHGALVELCRLYESFGVALGELRAATGATQQELEGAVVLCPPSALHERWSRRLPDPVRALASGWMRVRLRAKQQNVELPLVISDHADWPELTGTIAELRPREVWVTHGRDDALIYWANREGIPARALSLLGRDEEDE